MADRPNVKYIFGSREERPYMGHDSKEEIKVYAPQLVFSGPCSMSHIEQCGLLGRVPVSGSEILMAKAEVRARGGPVEIIPLNYLLDVD